MHMAFGASAADGAGRGGVAVALWGPSVVQLQVGAGSAQPEVSATINVSTAFPFEQDATVIVARLAAPTAFPIKLRIPAWSGEKTILKLNGKVTSLPPIRSGFISVSQTWCAGGTVGTPVHIPDPGGKALTFSNGNHANLSHSCPWCGAHSTGGRLFCEVEVGALNFAPPLEETPAGLANYAIDCDASTMSLSKGRVTTVQPRPSTGRWTPRSR